MDTGIKEEENKVEKLLANVIECVETRYDLVAIDVQDKVSDIMASVAFTVILGALIAFSLLLLSIGGAMYISDYFESAYIGFVYMSLLYVALALVIYFGRNKLIKLPIINSLLKKFNFHAEN